MEVGNQLDMRGKGWKGIQDDFLALFLGIWEYDGSIQ